MTDKQPEVRSDIDKICSAVMADTEALEDAKMTLEVIMKTDPGVYDEMINDTLSLIRKALSTSILGVIEKLPHLEANQNPYGYVWFTHFMEMRFTRTMPNEKEMLGKVTPVYTAPFIYECTDEQLIEVVRSRGFVIRDAKIGGKWHELGSDDFNDFNPYFKAEEAARWAERKLKEKNYG
jgi:hypothetical protein